MKSEEFECLGKWKVKREWTVKREWKVKSEEGRVKNSSAGAMESEETKFGVIPCKC